MITQRSLYGGTDHFITKDLPLLGIKHTKVDSGDATTFKQALQSNTKASCLPLRPLFHAVRLGCCALCLPLCAGAAWPCLDPCFEAI